MIPRLTFVSNDDFYLVDGFPILALLLEKIEPVPLTKKHQICINYDELRSPLKVFDKMPKRSVSISWTI
ncbi:hypothetical protein L2E82_50595 [Cichorium intybus]|nr:hypothetical protein L2E82_50595 [Cichorium intybus]